MTRQHTHSDLRQILLGTGFIFCVGSLLHFVYAWSGEAWVAAIIGAVNESTWEHLKIAFWPGIMFATGIALLEKRWDLSFWASQGYGLAAVSILIIVLFYGYVALIGTNILAIDVSVFLIAILIGQIIAAKFIHVLVRSRPLRLLGLWLLIFQIYAFATFTLTPPTGTIFKDPQTGRYGILN